MLAQYQAMRESYVRVEAELKAVEAELVEVDNVLENLQSIPNDREIYKLVGHVLIRKTKDEVVKELQEKKELLGLKRDKYKKQLEVLGKQIAELENKIKEALARYGIPAQKQA